MNTSEMTNNWSVQVAGMLAITAACVAVFWIAEGFEAALPIGLVLGAFTAVVHFGRRRSNTLEVMSGTGDERVRSLYTRAVAIAGTVMAFLLPGWWLVTVAEGDPNTTLSTLSAIFGATFIVAVVYLARRS
jgi:4-amino-4-deoxy-L-arabinose transferase-like glycosyltransferase